MRVSWLCASVCVSLPVCRYVINIFTYQISSFCGTSLFFLYLMWNHLSKRKTSFTFSSNLWKPQKCQELECKFSFKIVLKNFFFWPAVNIDFIPSGSPPITSSFIFWNSSCSSLCNRRSIAMYLRKWNSTCLQIWIKFLKFLQNLSD